MPMDAFFVLGSGYTDVFIRIARHELDIFTKCFLGETSSSRSSKGLNLALCLYGESSSHALFDYLKLNHRETYIALEISR